MARKLTDEEREKINELTGVLCKALPAAQRNFGAGIASALVRIPRPQITMRDLGRICGKYGEDKAMLIELVKTEVLDAVEGQEGPVAWTLRSFVAAATPEEGPAGEKDAEAVTAEAEPEPVVEAEMPVETAGVAPEKPKSTRRRRRGGASAEAEPEAAAEAAETVPEPLAEKPRPGRGSRRRAAAAAAAAASEAATEEADLEPAAPELAASESTEAPASAPSSKPRSRRRYRSAEAAETSADAATSDAPASPDASEPAEAPVEKPRSRRRRRSAAKPEVSESAPSTAKESASEDAQVTPSVEPTVPVDPQPAAAPEPAPEPPAPATPEPPAAPEPSPEPDAPAPARRGRLRRRSSRPGRREEAKQPKGLAEVPYVRRGGETEAQIREKIVALDQRFWMNGWLLSHPGAYTLYEREITSLNDALKDGTLHGDITRRQLAYQMGGDEKFFEFGSDGLKLLRAMGVEDLIRHRPMPKPDLLYHAPRRRKHMRVLVTENLDPWLDVRDLMYEDGRSLILGERIHAVVLGGGTPVLEHNRLALLLDTLGADDLEVLYWGDIDRAGLEIYAKLRDMLTPTYAIKPFTVAYQLMADRAAERFPDPLENETTGQINIELADPALICEGLTPEAAAYSRTVLENCRLVPQEILTKRDL